MEIPVLEKHIVLGSFAIEFLICAPPPKLKKNKKNIRFEGQLPCFEIELSHSSGAL